MPILQEIQQNNKDTLNNQGYKGNCTLNNQYYIDKSQPILSLFNKFCEAYAVKDIQNSNDQSLYARIWERSMVLEISDIEYIISNNVDSFNNPLAIGIVEVEPHNTQEEYMAIIYRKILGASLGELIDKNEHFSDKYIIKNILHNINEVLGRLHSLNIAHGSINLDNIYLTNDGIIVEECFTAPSGYNQSYFYEPVTIPKALRYAKNNKNFSADYYALGVVCLQLVLRKRIKKNVEKLDMGRISGGSYRHYLDDVILTGTINKIIQGLLQDEAEERFGYEELSNIANLASFVPKTSKADFNEPISFNDKKIYSAKALAYEMSINLKRAKSLVYSGTLQLFLQKCDNNKKLFKRINSILKSSIKLCAGIDLYTEQDLTIAEIIKALGSQDVFSVNELSLCFEKYAIANVILHLVNNNEQNKLKLLSDIIQYQIATYPDKFKDNNFFYIYHNIANTSHNDHVFNLLLTLYKIFPKLPYLGTLKQKKVIVSISEILLYFEQSGAEKILFTDKHIEAFLCSKLQIDYFQKIKELKHFLHIADLHSIKLLILFAEAQEECKIDKLPYLSNIFSQNIITKISAILHSNKTKQDFIQQVNSAKSKGKLKDILNVIMQEKLLQDDSKN